MSERVPTSAQAKKARLQMMEATDVFRQQGWTRDQVLAIAGGMYDFNARWAELAAETEQEGEG